MSRTPVARLLVAAAGLGAAAVAARRLRGPAAPVFLAPPSAPTGLLRPAPPATAPPATAPPDPDAGAPEPAPPAPAEPAPAEPAPAEPAPAEPASSPAPSEPEPGARDAGAPEPASDRSPAPPGERWVFPLDDGRCPPSHPIKAKLRSGLYHQPGMAAYERTHPDRCYAEAVDAEADGLRRAKH